MTFSIIFQWWRGAEFCTTVRNVDVSQSIIPLCCAHSWSLSQPLRWCRSWLFPRTVYSSFWMWLKNPSHPFQLQATIYWLVYCLTVPLIRQYSTNWLLPSAHSPRDRTPSSSLYLLTWMIIDLTCFFIFIVIKCFSFHTALTLLTISFTRALNCK